MPNRKKKNPRDILAIFRVTKDEFKKLKDTAKSLGLDLSKYLRRLAQLDEQND